MFEHEIYLVLFGRPDSLLLTASAVKVILEIRNANEGSSNGSTLDNIDSSVETDSHNTEATNANESPLFYLKLAVFVRRN